MAFTKHPEELLGQSYLRVYSPKTTDGRTPLIINGIQQFREDHLPMTAMRLLEKRNVRLPVHLRKRIEIVNADPKPIVGPSVPVTIKDPRPEVFETQLPVNKIPEAPKKKGGRPRKADKPLI